MGRHYLQPGDTFFTVTKRMDKNRHNCQYNAEFNGPRITYEVLRPGTRRYFEKGKRKYLCEVLGLVETKTGYYIGSLPHFSMLYSERAQNIQGIRYWQFTYLVMVVEN